MNSFEYQIIRKPHRKTASISVKPDCSVRVVVPNTLSDQKIAELVDRKSKWIRNKIYHFEEIRQNIKPKEYVSGECFTYLGRNYRLKIVGNVADNNVKLMNGRFYVYLPPETSHIDRGNKVNFHLTHWYKQHAVIRLRDKTVRYAKQLGLEPKSVVVKDYKSRWASCHSDGRISYNWKIIIAPHSVVDYVVVHELCHLLHHDHSKKFWKCVENVLPDYRERKEWLKINGQSLNV